MSSPASWAARAAGIGARPHDPARGLALFDRHCASTLPALDAAMRRRLAGHLHFAEIDDGSRLIVHGEPGEFMAIVLEGAIAVEGREEAAGAGLAEPGHVVGEISLLDAGPRLFDCTARGRCVVAVLDAPALATLMRDDPPLALVLLAGLARRLSRRLRQAGSRLPADG